MRDLILSAKFNFENFERSVPMIRENLYYRIAKAQLDEACGGKPAEESLKAGYLGDVNGAGSDPSTR